MSTQIILKVLALRHRLRQRDRWTRRQLEAHQTRELRLLREHTYAHSPFYGCFHKGFTDRPIDGLPVLTKEMVMEHFDELVTDPTVRLADVEAHLASLSGGDRLALLAAASPFGEGEVEIVRWPGSVPAFVPQRLRRQPLLREATGCAMC
jgi:hypothetical protein